MLTDFRADLARCKFVTRIVAGKGYRGPSDLARVPGRRLRVAARYIRRAGADSRAELARVERVDGVDGRTHAGWRVQMYFIASRNSDAIRPCPGRLPDDLFEIFSDFLSMANENL
jgi:hypothetical protein